MPKYARESTSTFQSANAPHALWLRASFMSDCSCWIADESHSRSSGEPGGVGGPVSKEPKGYEAEHQCGDAFYEEEPLPASQTEQAVELHQGARDRRADDSGYGRSGHKHGGYCRAIICGEPVAQIEDDSRKEAGFSEAEQKSQA